MKRRNPDPRYYLCPHVPCTGTAEYFGQDARKQAVYECTECRRRMGEASLLIAHGQRKLRD